MEVHPPHHPLHSWKDFFVHIATITVGLLIAIGLEQSVEAMHHRHQRHQLEEDLREEGEHNRETVRKDLAYEDVRTRWYVEANHSVRETMAGRPAPLPPEMGVVAGDGEQLRYVIPTNSVWVVAQSSGQVGLLPREVALVYTRLYRVHALVTELDLEERKSKAMYTGVVGRFEDRPPVLPADLSRLTPAQLDDFSRALMAQYAVEASLRNILSAFDGANEAVLSGAKTEQEVVEKIYQYQNDQAAKAREGDSSR